MCQSKRFISILILLAIGLHALPLLQKLQGQTQTFWPFMAWGMYKKSRDSDQPVQSQIDYLIAMTSSGAEVEIGPWESGLSSFALERVYIEPMRQGDRTAARRLAERLNRNREDSIVAFRLESETYTITDSGIVKSEAPVIDYRDIN